MDKDIMYTLNVYHKNIEKLETQIRANFDIKFLAYDQYELKVSFVNELSDEQEEQLFEILENINKN